MHETSPRLLRHAQVSFGPLNINGAHHFAADHSMAVYARNTVFSFIPKNGCSSLRYSAALENQVIDGPDKLPWIHQNNVTFRPTLRDFVTADYTFVVLRCPFQRLVSCFLHRIVDQTASVPLLQKHALAHRMRLSGRMERWFGRFLQSAVKASPALQQAITFADFVSMLETPDALRLEVHWRPQVDYLVYQSYDDVFSLENMDHMTATVRARSGFSIHDTRAITNHGNHARDRITTGFFGRTDAGTLRRLKDAMKVPAYESFYDADLYQRVSRLYQEDVKLYARHFGQSALMQVK